MKRRFTAVLASLFLLSGCHSGEPATPEETGRMPYGKWDFAFFTPKALYAEVTQALVIDEKGGVYLPDAGLRAGQRYYCGGME